MLLLTRRVGESLRIFLEDGRYIDILYKRGIGQVQIGIEAPKSLSILRHEIMHLKDKELNNL